MVVSPLSNRSRTTATSVYFAAATLCEDEVLSRFQTNCRTELSIAEPHRRLRTADLMPPNDLTSAPEVGRGLQNDVAYDAN